MLTSISVLVHVTFHTANFPSHAAASARQHGRVQDASLQDLGRQTRPRTLATDFSGAVPLPDKAPANL